MGTPPQAGTAPEPSADAVRKQLQTLLGSESFANAPRLSRFLAYVVEQTLLGNGGDLKEYRIGLDVFQRPETYDPKTDPAVRVEARQLRFKLAEYYESRGGLDPVLITVPKGAYAARFEQVASPVAPPEAPPAPSTSLWTRKAAMGSAIIAAAILAVLWFSGRGRSPSNPQPSIAVLPFVNLSGDPGDDYFTDGLADEITDALARTKALRLIARSSAFQFKGKNVDIRQTGRDLNVSAILTGSVSRSGGRVKILAQLARASDGSLEWSRRYERAESDLFALQSSLASDIAASLQVTLAPTAARYTTRDARAQDYFMRARYEADQLTRESLLRAIGDYERAIQIDPGYAAAHYGLAVARHRLPAYANDPRLFDRAAIEREYRKAIELDPNFAEPHTGLALLAAYADWDWARAERELETASGIAPNAMAESHSALLALIRGKRAAVPEHIRRARDLDPLGVAILMNTAEIQVMAGECQAAREVLDRFSAQHPEVDNARLWLALSYLFEGKPDDAISRLQALKGRIPETDAYMAAAHALAGRREDALRLIRAYQSQPDRSEAGVAAVYGYLGDKALTLSWLEKSVARREPAAVYLGVHPAFAFLRGNPAFQEIARRHGLSY